MSSQESLAQVCRTTVLTVADAGVRKPGCLPAWVEHKTGSSDYDLLTVPSFRALAPEDAEVLAADITAAVTLHGGERLMTYVNDDIEPVMRLIDRWLPEEVRNHLERLPPWEIPKACRGTVSETLVIGCMDFRLHRGDGMMSVLGETLGETDHSFDLMATAGGGRELRSASERREMVERQIRKNGYRRVIVLSHMDCGKYGGDDAFTNPAHQKASLCSDLNDVHRSFGRRLQGIELRTGITHLKDGRVSRVTLF